MRRVVEGACWLGILILFPGLIAAWQASPGVFFQGQRHSLCPVNRLPVPRLRSAARQTSSILRAQANAAPSFKSDASHPIDVSLESWKRAAEMTASGPSSISIDFSAADPEVVAAVGDALETLSSEKKLVAAADQVDWTVLTAGNVMTFDFRGAKIPLEPALGEPIATLSKLRMQRWVKRVIIGMKVCPFTQSVEWAATGLEKVNVEPGPISYPMSGSKKLVHVMVDLWTDIASMLSKHPTDHSTTLLLLPKFSPDNWDRFQLASHVIVKSLTSLGVDDLASVVFFHPFYERDAVYPLHEPIHGHLPPGQMLRSMLLVYYDMDEIIEMDSTLHQNDYSRRTPFPMINILRSEQVQLAEKLTAGTKVYCANARKMAGSDATELTRALAKDMVADSP